MSREPESLTGLERRLGRVFVAGLSLSAASLVAGLVLYLAFPDTAAAPWLLSLGLVTLMATPLIRVLVSLAEYIRMREWFFVLTTVAVIIELSVTVIYALRQR
jgi:uncharacterized membrane protein